MQKVILFYKFVPLEDPETVMFWQRSLCERLSLKGRVLISDQGINATLGGKLENLREYKREMSQHPKFKKIQYKWSNGGEDDFPKLKVKVRDEIVSFRAKDEIKVDETGVVGGGRRIKPDELHELLENRGEDVIFYDGRNAYEAQVGRFKNSIIPKVQNTRDFKKDIEQGEISKYKDKAIVTYCTGGIRCEILTVLLKNRGFKEVYQLDGGIVTYGERYADDGLWEGKLYVFDERMVTAFSDKAQDLGSCIHCGGKTSRFVNCANKQCNKLILVCSVCEQNLSCSADCARALNRDKVLTK